MQELGYQMSAKEPRTIRNGWDVVPESKGFERVARNATPGEEMKMRLQKIQCPNPNIRSICEVWLGEDVVLGA